jgi:hypothetical protein
MVKIILKYISENGYNGEELVQCKYYLIEDTVNISANWRRIVKCLVNAELLNL